MTPNEIKILRIVEENDKVSKQKIAGLLGFSTDYAGFILETVAQGGYIEKVSRGRYSILPKGIDALLSQLYLLENKLKAELVRFSMESGKVKQEIKRLIEHKNNMVLVLSPVEERT